MRWYLKRTPQIFKILFPQIVWNKNSQGKSIYLTFDDGPVVDVTTVILDILRQKNVKATFFCLGKNLIKEKQIAAQAISEGHLLCNHSFDHENSWTTSTSRYLDSVNLCQAELESLSAGNSFFRPPFGRLKLRDFRKIKKHFKIVMWSLLSADFDINKDKNHCLNTLIRKTKPGDIVVFHDNEKSINKVEYVLPRYIDYCLNQGYKFSLINEC
ncbi:MAG: polysaccharide deacetylase family protein [Reichenbachiella sp.]